MPRLGYRKSRTGCQRCKQRRVKCDEDVPCAACIRHGVRCSLLNSPPRTGSSGAERPPPEVLFAADSARRHSWASTSTPSPGSSCPPPLRPLRSLAPAITLSPPGQLQQVQQVQQLQPEQQPHFSHLLPSHNFITTTQPPAMAEPSPELDLDSLLFFSDALQDHRPETTITWIMDLELMHNYTSSTYRTLPRANELYSVWQTEVPRMALRYSFLMHQILAISAFHMAYECSAEERAKYRIQADQHQNDAAKGLRDALSGISDENCHALFAASSMLTLSAFATHVTASRDSDNSGGQSPSTFSAAPSPSSASVIDELVNVISLIRGMSSILDAWESNIKQGPMARLLRLPNYENRVALFDALVDRLAHLELPGDLFAGDGDGGGGGDAGAAAAAANHAVCQKEATNLIKAIELSLASTSVPHVRVTIAWPIGLDRRFIALLRARHPAALVVVAYYATSLHAAGSKNWYFSGWGARVLRGVARLLGPRRAHLVEWQMRCLDEEMGSL